jgi:hypothetical protein
MKECWGKIVKVVEENASMQVVEVIYDDSKGPAKRRPRHRAIVYLELVPRCQGGEHVLLNITATTRGLGTGGYDFVVAVDHRDIPTFDGSLLDYGHIMKLRYTPLQREVATVEEPDSPYYEALQTASDLDGMPVVCCGLHSQVPLVAAAIKSVDPTARVAYCMTDEAALMLAFSEVNRACREAGLIDLTLTCGQALGGDFEAVNLHSALLACRVAFDADVVIVGIGPGIVGTSTMFGHGGVAQAEALNCVAALGGLPIATLRLSFADERPRHHRISHHSLSSLARLTLARTLVPVPQNLKPDEQDAVARELATYHIDEKHEIVPVPFRVADIDMRGVEVTTMGRDYPADPAFFKAAWAAGFCGAQALAAERL